MTAGTQAIGRLPTTLASSGQRSEGAETDLSGHMPALDGVRGLAILAVCVFHMTVLMPAGRLDRAWAFAASFGWAGVDLFFALSGFLITGILLDSKGGANYFRNFYARRVLRIFPLYYAVVTMCLVVLPHVHHAAALTFGKIDGSSIWYWLYFCNLSIARHNAFPHGPLSVCWSLAIEEQFYMVWPLLVLLLNRRQLIGACIGAGVVALASRLWLERAGAGWIPIYVLTPCRIDSLAAGALVAAMARGPGGLTGCLPTMKKGAIAFGMLLVVLLLVQQSGWLWRAPGRLVAYTLLAGLFASLLPLAISRPAASSVGKFLTSRPMRMLGRYSYAMYLFHVPCRDVAEVLMNPRHFPTILGTRLPGQMLFYVLALGLTIASAWASWTLFESPILRLKRFFPVDRKPARVPQRQIVRSGVGSTSRAPVQPHVDIDLAAEEALNCG